MGGVYRTGRLAIASGNFFYDANICDQTGNDIKSGWIGAIAAVFNWVQYNIADGTRHCTTFELVTKLTDAVSLPPINLTEKGCKIGCRDTAGENLPIKGKAYLCRVPTRIVDIIENFYNVDGVVLKVEVPANDWSLPPLIPR